MKFMRRHMWIGAALLVVAAAGYLVYGAAFRLDAAAEGAR